MPGPIDLLQREIGSGSQGRSGDLPTAVARKLALECVLDGHNGCVNRLAWNMEGSMLASASDDCQVLLWHYPDTSRVPLALRTQHRANLFGVQFLPFHNNSKIITGAMDHTVQLHELEAGAFRIAPRYRSSSSSNGSNGSSTMMRRHPQQPQVHTIVPRTTVYNCHKGRVKEVEVCPAEPSLFWSAAEDGMVRQYDLRAPNQKVYGSPNVLINMATAGPQCSMVECKGLDLNPVNPNLLAVACGDPHVRVFDRRQLSPGVPGSSCTGKPLLQLTGPHLPMLLKAGISRRAHSTHVSFSHRGDRLITSYHSDHAYIFDVTGAAQGCPVTLQQQQQQTSCRHSMTAAAAALVAAVATCSDRNSSGSSSGCFTADEQAAAERVLPADLPSVAEVAKVSGNSALFEQRYMAAVADFTAAIAAAPWVPGLYTQRALALLKRGWEGDAAYALRDCEAALALVAQSSSKAGAAAAAAAEQQARLRMVHALKQLGQCQCALAALDSYIRHYPTALGSAEISSLSKLLQHHVQQRQLYRAKVRQQRQHTQQQWQRRRDMQAAAATAAAAAQRWPTALQQQRQQDQATADSAASDGAAALRTQRAAAAAAAAAPPPPPPPPPPPHQAAAAAAAGVGHEAAPGLGDDDTSSSSSDSRSLGPDNAARVLLPPGPGFRVDTDLDSDELEDTQQQQQQQGVGLKGRNCLGYLQQRHEACEAAAAADTVEAEEAFIGPMLPSQAPSAVDADAVMVNVTTYDSDDNGSPQAAAAAAPQAAVAAAPSATAATALAVAAASDTTAAGATPAAETAAAAAPMSGGHLDIADLETDDNSDNDNDDDDDDDNDVMTDQDPDVGWEGDCVSDDELLMPWYGPSEFAKEQIQKAVAAEHDTRQQQQPHQQQMYQSSSSSSSGCRRRRRRSCSCSDEEFGGNAHRLSPTSAAAAAAMSDSNLEQQQQQQQQHRNRQHRHSSGSSARQQLQRRRRRAAAAGVRVPAAAAALEIGVPRMAAAAAAAPAPVSGAWLHHHSSAAAAPLSSNWWDTLSGGAGRLLQRCMGHCNVQTDIKEAVFLGPDDALVACGSDDGRVFIYEAATGAAVKVLNADEDVANCVQSHPCLPVLATSGIESVIRLWSPLAASDVSSCDDVISNNQQRMRQGPRLLRGAALPPAALQASLADNPQLLQLLVQQLYGVTTALGGDDDHEAVPGGGVGGPAAGRRRAGAALQGLGPLQFNFINRDDDEDDQDDDDDEFDDDEADEAAPGGAGSPQRRRRRAAARGDVACRVS